MASCLRSPEEVQGATFPLGAAGRTIIVAVVDGDAVVGAAAEGMVAVGGVAIAFMGAVMGMKNGIGIAGWGPAGDEAAIAAAPIMACASVGIPMKLDIHG